MEDAINFSVFPGHQGGPHNHTIAALATALLQTTSPEYKEYQQKVVSNSKYLAQVFKDLGYSMLTNGTDTHLLVLDLRSVGTDGARAERILELVNIATNKNTIPSDKSALVPHGLRLGTPAMTTRGFGPQEFHKVALLIHTAIQIALKISQKTTSKKFKDFKDLVDNGECKNEIEELKGQVVEFVREFPLVVSKN